MDSIRSRRAAVAASLQEHLPVMERSLRQKQALRRHGEIAKAIDAMGSGRLCRWVAVAVWENEDGSRETEVMGDVHSNDPETKEYLHDAILKFELQA